MLFLPYMHHAPFSSPAAITCVRLRCRALLDAVVESTAALLSAPERWPCSLPCSLPRRKDVSPDDLKPVRSLLQEWSLKRYLESREAIRPLVLHSNTTIAEALEVFAQNNVSSAPVVDCTDDEDEAFSSYLVRVGAMPCPEMSLTPALLPVCFSPSLTHQGIAQRCRAGYGGGHRRAFLTFPTSSAPSCAVRLLSADPPANSLQQSGSGRQ